MNARKACTLLLLVGLVAAAVVVTLRARDDGPAAGEQGVPLVCRSCAHGFTMPLAEFMEACDDTGVVDCPQCASGKAARGAPCAHCGRPVAYIDHGFLVETCPGCGQDPMLHGRRAPH